EELHDDVGAAVGRLAVIEDADDTGMVELRGGPGLVEEARQQLGILRIFGPEHLHDHAAPQCGVHGLVDHAHRALAELAHDLVVAEGPPDHDAYTKSAANPHLPRTSQS